MKRRATRLARWMATEGASIVGAQVFILSALVLNVGTQLPWQVALGVAAGLSGFAYLALVVSRRALLFGAMATGASLCLNVIS